MNPTCPKCKANPRPENPNREGSKFAAYCKPCELQKAKEWRLKNLDYARNYSKSYMRRRRRRGKEGIRCIGAIGRSYCYWCLAARKREYRARNPEKTREQSRRYNATYKAKLKAAEENNG